MIPADYCAGECDPQQALPVRRQHSVTLKKSTRHNSTLLSVNAGDLLNLDWKALEHNPRLQAGVNWHCLVFNFFPDGSHAPCIREQNHNKSTLFITGKTCQRISGKINWWNLLPPTWHPVTQDSLKTGLPATPPSISTAYQSQQFGLKRSWHRYSATVWARNHVYTGTVTKEKISSSNSV